MENLAVKKRKRRGKTHCIRGHEFTEDNTYVSPKSGARVCRVCLYARNKAWEKDNPEKARAIRTTANRRGSAKRSHRRYALGKLGWTEEMYDASLKLQNGKCALCGDCSKVLCADHAHIVPPKARELLCMSCNKALGLFKENVETLQKAIAYIVKHF